MALRATTAAALMGTVLSFVGIGPFRSPAWRSSSCSNSGSSASTYAEIGWGTRPGPALSSAICTANHAREEGKRRGGQGGRGKGGTALWMARRETWTDIPLKDFYDAVGIYISTNGGNTVPEDFVVPFDASLWPERMQGLKLGRYFKKLVTDAELREQDPGMVARLEEELGVEVGLSDWDKFFQALLAFKRIKNSMKVLARFVIPSEDPWPSVLWGYRLGVRVGNLRTTGRFLTGLDEETKEERVSMLNDIGFEWKPRLPKKSLEDLNAWFNPIVEALKVYARMGGDISDIKPFVDPEILSDAEVPDFEALQKEVPEAIPWRDQDHRVGSESILEDEEAPTDIFFVPGLRRHQRRQARLAGKGKTMGGAEAAGMNGGKEGGGEGGREDGLPEKKTRGRKVGSGAGGKRKGKKEGEGEEGEEVTGTSAKVGGTSGPKKRGRKPKVVE
ncbi:hypothetical protein NSK_006350 [Nannochloropsis salina CCMP1776]|uniref:Helicase-associated domain-containing protein n=1 Tax=Nannochloropsis salina CCMP1776 TaxID=1027361 RepID=A0A4D9CT48_9STRA|nr:hypothetical protein NSK_006350 [Nannochloropsis salina CCMP1776]|eukprot:TFJ82340.1 hypothetical protein NSK_006350 [Nannochloropsis salina CCMP1776]